MKHFSKYIGTIILVVAVPIFAQNDPGELRGTVYGLEAADGHQHIEPLLAANIFWQNSTIGTTSDEYGQFIIPRLDNEGHHLIINYVGFENDTLFVRAENNNIIVHLKTIRSANAVHVHAEKPQTMHRKSTAVNTERITSAGLTQLACCSLAESFENTTSVDVEQSDAVSGARRIKMLGLAGFYTQVMIEKKPVMRGLVNPFSLEYVPGFWMEAVDISKGTASVATGYESITGQINVELKKPERAESFSTNAYLNSMGKADLAILGTHEVTPQLSTMLLTFGTYLNQRWDNNEDGFIDMPLLQQFNLMNRWKYQGEEFRGQIGVKVIQDDRRGGQFDYDFDQDRTAQSFWGSENKNRRYELYAKGGKFLDEAGSSIGMILSAFQHDIDAFAGSKTYEGVESSFYTNLFYNKILAPHILSFGLSYQYDDRQETYQDTVYDNSERVPGIFGEYTFQPNEAFTALFGVRFDRHNRYGNLLTPRVHFNYRPDLNSSLRLSAGKGYRHPNIFVDNPAILASSKQLVLMESLNAEEAWNAGMQFSRDFDLGLYRPVSLVMDYYRTEFQNQVVVDMEQSAQHIYLYNLAGESYSNAFQAELSSTLALGLDVTAAVRYNDVQNTYNGELQAAPLNVPHKGLLVLSYSTPDNDWEIDFTTQFNGKARLPNTSMNPTKYQLDEYSPAHMLMFGQLKRVIDDWEIYVGVENLTGYRQEYPILAWDDPFSSYFDSSIIWGPTFGRRFYVGFRFR